MKILKSIRNWFYYNFTKKGKEEKILLAGMQGMQSAAKTQTLAKVSAVVTANGVQKTQKILTFNKGKSVAKPKKSLHETLQIVKEQNGKELANNNIKLTKKGKFKNA